MTTLVDTRRQPSRNAVLACSVAAVVAVGVGTVVPLASPLLVALVLGILVINVGGAERTSSWHDARLTRTVLRAGIVLLGLRLSLADLGEVGLRGAVVAAVAVAVTFTATWLVGRRMGLEPGLVLLIAAGFSVCGAAAIAAVESGVRRRSADVVIAIALVTVFGTAMIPLLPLASGLLGLDDVQAGVWAGASIHEVAQVVASAALLGPSALAAATTVKLARVALLGAVFVAARRLGGGDDAETVGAPVVPWFVWGFLAAVAVRSTGLVPSVVISGADKVAVLALGAAMFGLGMTVTIAALRRVERRALVLATYATGVAALASFVPILLLF